MAQSGSDLAVRRTRVWGLLSGLLVVVGIAALAVWHSQHPAPLTVEERTVTATVPVDQAVYVGVAAAPTGRTLHLSGVKVHTTSNTDVEVTPLLCRDGRLEATTEPEAYCSELVNPEGTTLGVADSIVLRVTSDQPAVAVIDPVRLGFRESLQWGTLPTGAGAVVRVLAR